MQSPIYNQHILSLHLLGFTLSQPAYFEQSYAPVNGLKLINPTGIFPWISSRLCFIHESVVVQNTNDILM